MKGVCRFGIKGKLAPCYIGPHPIIWSYQRSYRGFIMCFMSPNSRDVWSLQQMWLSKIPSHWNRIWRTRHIPLRFSTNKTESHATRLLSSTRSNGIISPKTKPRGNVRSSCGPTTPSFFHRGNHPTPVCSYAFISISGRDFLYGGRAVTPRVTETLIKVINK
jgi:hypothetical protein